MSQLNNGVAQLYEHSSRPTADADSDPLMLLYRTLDVHTPDIARVVLRIHNLRMLASTIDSRLSPLLLRDVHGYDLSIASLLSVHGKGLKYLTTETKSYSFSDTTKQNQKTMKEVFMGDANPGNKGGFPMGRD